MTGHIWVSEPAGVRSRVRSVLGRLRARGGLVVVSPLAAGADRLVAAEGVAAGAALEAVLPFAPQEYERDFPDSVAEFRGLLDRCRAVEILPGDPRAGARRDASYTAVGRAVVRRCDVMLAIWDGRPPRGEGGTGQIVAEAVAAGMPVVWVSLDGGVHLLPADHHDRSLAELVARGGAD